MAPIRVALVGLSASAKTSWAEEAHLPYLLSPLGRTHYELVALLNSSVSAAEVAKKHFNLPAHVNTYGDPEALAADPDIDLVVINTRVDTHFKVAEPSVRAGKALYVEWPIAESYDRAVTLASQQPSKDNSFPNSIAGVQGRYSPVALKLKELLRSDSIGTVLSSDVTGFANLISRESLPETLQYFSDRKVGGNLVTIAYAHMIDYVHEVLGEFHTFSSRMQIQRPSINIIDTNGTQIRTVDADVPDFLTVHGQLARGTQRPGIDVADEATLAVTFRSGQPFAGAPGFEWRINGTKGEIRLTAPGPYLMSHSYDNPFVVEVHDHATNKMTKVQWDWEEWQKDLPVLARNVAQLYQRYANWVENGKKDAELDDADEWPRIHDAVKRHKEIESLFKQFDKQK